MPARRAAARRNLIRTTVALAGLLAAARPLWSAELTVVDLVDGRTVRGEPDAKTDDQRLWIRREAAGVQLSSSFVWEQVRVVRQGARQFVGREFLPVAQRSSTAGKSFLQVAPYPLPQGGPSASEGRGPRRPLEGQPSIEQPSAPEPEPPVSELLRRRQAERRVRTLYVEAYLAQWDGDPQADGLRVFVYPLSADGELVAVSGQIELSLLGEIEKVGASPEFHELDRANQALRPADFARGPGVVELPFRQFHPDFNLDVARQAVVHARLRVPGQGVFESSDANVQLRGYSRARDQLQMFTRQRYYREEHAIPPLR